MSRRKDKIVAMLDKLLENYYTAIRAKKTTVAEQILSKIRETVLLYGIPEEKHVYMVQEIPENEFLKHKIEVPKIRKCEMTMRGRVWKVLLGINGVKQSEYIGLIKKKECRSYGKIRGDTERLWATDSLFKQRVREDRLVRVLNSFSHKFNKPYVQGMDVLAGGMLFVMPEIDAFAGMSRLVNECFPLYWLTGETHDLVGAYAGAILVKDVLSEVDQEVYRMLSGLPPLLYAFATVTSLSGIAPPFEELLRLWDFVFSFGVHVNVLCVAAQIILQRSKILTTKRNKIPQTILAQRKWPRLDAKKVIATTMKILPIIKGKTELWERVCLHTVDRDIATRILKEHENYKY